MSMLLYRDPQLQVNKHYIAKHIHKLNRNIACGASVDNLKIMAPFLVTRQNIRNNMLFTWPYKSIYDIISDSRRLKFSGRIVSKKVVRHRSRGKICNRCERPF